MSSELSISVRYTKEFKRNVSELSKKYRNIRKDIQPSLDQIARGDLIGDRVSDLGEKTPGVPYCVYKWRIKNRDNNKGKSAGYRLIYEVFNETESILITLITIYSKSDQSSVSSHKIKEIINTTVSPEVSSEA